MAGQVRVGDGDAARHDLKAGDLVDRERRRDRRRRARRGSAAARTSCSRRSTRSRSIPPGLVAVDVGASTGGFTDVLLARGATRVYAVDVGYGQLAERCAGTRGSCRMERVNARTLTAETLPEPADLAVIDVSFISLGPGPGAGARSCCATARADRRPRQAAVRGRPRGCEGRRGAGPGGAPAGPAGDRGAGRGPRHRHARRRSRRRSSGRRATGSSWPSSAPGRPAPSSTSGSTRPWPPRGRRPRDVRRIGFAYNPTSDAAIELRERAAGWCQVRGVDHWAAPAGETATLVASCRRRTCWSCSAATGRSCARPRPSPQVDVPLLGVNLGKVGFLSKAEAHELEPVLVQLVAGDFTVRRADGPHGRDPAGGPPGRRARSPRSTTSSSPAARWHASCGWT